MRRRVVITGLGLMTVCGQGWKPYWEFMINGRSVGRPLSGSSLKKESPIPCVGQIADFNPLHFIKQKKSLKLMSREIQLAVAASHLALQDAALELDDATRQRFGISLGVGIINNDLDEIGVAIRNSLDEQGEFQMSRFGQEGLLALYPLWLLKYLPNMPACHVSIAHGLRGPSNTITTSSAASAQAVGEAYQIIRRGDADLMLAGGSDSKINAMGMSRFHLLGLLSQRGTYSPFDEHHDGIVPGEGAGLLVLEEYHHAVRRGARIYGELLGYGSSSDFNYDPRVTEDFNGKCLAMTRALEDAACDLKEIDFLLANGSGIPNEDIQETRAVTSVFDRRLNKIRVTATKPITGHLVYGAGAVELAGTLLSLKHGVIPHVANLERPDPACDLPFVKDEPILAESAICLFNSFGFCGQNASLIVKGERL